MRGPHAPAEEDVPTREAKRALGLEPVVHARLVDAARRRGGSRLYGRDQLTSIAVGLAFVVTALVLAYALPSTPVPSMAVLVLLVLCHASMSRVQFELASGSFVPTQLALVPMLFLAPPALVPPLVAVGYILSGIPDLVRGRLHAERAFVRLSYSWHAVGPAIVFGLLTPGPPNWGDWPVYTLALASQFAFDLSSSLVREWLGVGVAPRVLLPVLGRTYLVDALLAPIGFLAALAATDSEFGFLPVISLAGLLALLQSDRRERIGDAIELTDAFETASGVARADQLTGLANRLAWDERIEAYEATRTTDTKPISVVLVDLDGLKTANDTVGHAFGDLLIQAVASIVANCVRERDLVARLGGDEFGILLPGAEEAGCAEFLRRLGSAIGRHPGIQGFPLSASVGAATCPPEPTLAQALARADARMYEQKRHSKFSRAHAAELDRAASSQ